MHMTEVAFCYGMTETSPVSHADARDDPLERAWDGRARSARTSRSRSSIRTRGLPSSAAPPASSARAATA
jgi:hypothetical protein